MGKLLKLRKEKGQRGQAMVEFALVLPLLLIITFIIIDFGFAFSQWVVITNATREGARLGATGKSADLVATRTIDASNGTLEGAGDLVTVEYLDLNGDGVGIGDQVVVKARHDYNLLTPLDSFLNLTGLNPITLSACTDMRVEIKVVGATGGGTSC
jgi:Flp pilus assembly protein TadG